MLILEMNRKVLRACLVNFRGEKQQLFISHVSIKNVKYATCIPFCSFSNIMLNISMHFSDIVFHSYAFYFFQKFQKHGQIQYTYILWRYQSK